MGKILQSKTLKMSYVALVQCVRCRTREAMHVSRGELEEIKSSQPFKRRCRECRCETSWSTCRSASADKSHRNHFIKAKIGPCGGRDAPQWLKPLKYGALYGTADSPRRTCPDNAHRRRLMR